MRVPTAEQLNPFSRADREPFPDSSDRPGQYRKVTEVIAVTLNRQGYPVTERCRETWGDLFARLADVDTLIEDDPDQYGAVELVGALGLPQTPKNVQIVQIGLEANQASIEAATLDDHFDSRRIEAVASTELMRLNSDELIECREMWDRLSEIAVTGIYFDSVLDAQQDAARLPQFSAEELAKAGLVRLTNGIRHADKTLLMGLVRSGFESGMGGYLFSRQRTKAISKRVFRDILTAR